MILEYTRLEDLVEVDNLRRSEQEAVGFVPMSKWEWTVKNRSHTFLTVKDADEITGYCWWTAGLPVAAIQQLVVRSDARRFERGSALVDRVLSDMTEPGRYGATCRCRADLPGVEFWLAVGFTLIRQEQSGRRGPVLRFYRSLQPALLDLGIYLPERFRGGGQRQGFRIVTHSS